ncbi:MAG: hypothetical protein CMO97_00285 [Woeseia sp.]|nr:hypothetical protein [Woeseia sp.]|tara:strand:- start:4578 stop:5189 length:612 start_codon:yes stop_codon:yes gene_type:complete
MMERALKERLIGAVVLVTFGVLVVPIFLDGSPKDSITVSEKILLPGQKKQDLKTIVLERERVNPIPSINNTNSENTKIEATNSHTVSDLLTESNSKINFKNESSIKQLEEIEQKSQIKVLQNTKSSTGMWTVQLGSFANKESAEKLYADLRKQGYAVFLSAFKNDIGQFHRVRIGPQKDKKSAELIAEKLINVGHKGEVLPYP